MTPETLMMPNSYNGPVISIGYLVEEGQTDQSDHGTEALIIPHHTLVAGTTGEAGKTTAIEGIISRWKNRAFVVFKTKRGELDFQNAIPHKPFFEEPPPEQLWRYVESIIESTMQEKNRIIRSTIMRVCRGKKTLNDVWAEVQIKLREARGFERDMLTQLDEYLKIVLPELKKHEFASELELRNGSDHTQNVTVMDLTHLSTELQAMVIGSVANMVMRVWNDVTLVIPEAWQFIPNGRKTPAKAAIENLVRQGRSVRNFVIIDSQDIAGIDPAIRKNVGNWLLGKQSEALEAERTLKEIPLPKKLRPEVHEVQSLKLGQFYVVANGIVAKVFAQPAWMSIELAIKCARNPDYVYTLTRPQFPNRGLMGTIEDGVNAIGKAFHGDNWPPKEQIVSPTQGEFIKPGPKPITTDGIIQTDQARVTVIQRQVVKPNLDESTLEGRIGVLMADGFFDIGKGTKDIHTELERHYPGQQTGYDNFRKNLCWKAMQFWSARPYGYIEKKGEVWQITELGKKYLVKVIQTS